MSLAAQRRATAQEGATVTPPTFVDSNSVTNNVAGTSTVVPFPALAVAGNLLLLAFETGGVSITTPGGWTLELGPITVPTVGGRFALFSKIATAGDISTGSVTVAHGNGERVGLVSAYTGVQQVQDGVAATATFSVSASAVTPTLTTAGAGSMVCRGALFNGQSIARTQTWPTSTKRIDASSGGANAAGGSQADRVAVAAGAVGTETSTLSAVSSGVCYTIAYIKV